MKITNATKNTILAENARVAATFLGRAMGLLGRSSLSKGEALVLNDCRAVHMFFMKFSIDVIFLDQFNRVYGVIENLRPFQVSPIFLLAKRAIELPSGSIKESSTGIGDLIRMD